MDSAISSEAARQELKPVSREESEALLASIERGCVERGLDRNAGIFGPGSMSWRVHCEAGLFLGAGRAALLQLAHPWVAKAIADHSQVMNRPIVRFHNTFRVVYAMIFGFLDQALGAARGLHKLHTRIEGEISEDAVAYLHPADEDLSAGTPYKRGSLYRANEVAALRWVYATLIETAVLAYETALGPMGEGEREAYYAETKTFAALFGIPGEVLPADWSAFSAYCRGMADSEALGVGERARAMGQNLLAGAGSRVKPPGWYRALTAAWMPERLRLLFGLPFDDKEQQAAERARRMLPWIYRKLPAEARFVGPWHEAQARLAGRGPGWITRASNRFWIGQEQLP